VSVIQNPLEWVHNKENYFMIQNKNTTHCYCFLQLKPPIELLFDSVIRDKNHIIDRNGRIVKNVNKGLIPGAVHCGPSLAIKGRHGLKDRDIVIPLSCKSWPKSAQD
jgi:hypothetical protein